MDFTVPPSSFVSAAAMRRTRHAIDRLLGGAEAPSLAALAAEAGVTPWYFQREFAACAGVSPKRFVEVLSKERLLGALAQGLPALEAALESGLSGPGRAHELLLRTEGMTPAQARRHGQGVAIVWGVALARWGPMFGAWTGQGLCALEFLPEDENSPESEASTESMCLALGARWHAASMRRDDALIARLIDAALDGDPAVPAHVKASHFRLRVWQALLCLPTGSLASYTQLARAVGRPDAVRAVAGAVAANHLAVLIPCHRVIREGAELAGYRWGLARKAMLIAAEQALIPG